MGERQPILMSLPDAVDEIKYVCDDTASVQSPFFFFVGAGISYPPIPLASHIVSECKQKVEKLKLAVADAPRSSIEEYSFWLQKAYPTPFQRRQMFSRLISKKYISRSNFRLAHLLLGENSQFVPANLVFTTNFDDFLTRALSLFGKHHVVCDHYATAMRIEIGNPQLVQIIHLHGTYQFYDFKNLSGEIEQAAQFSASSAATMASLLDAVLRERSPLVVGYSGWEGDVFMNALKRRLNRQTLPFNLYWFCFTEAALEGLPEWLKFHESVRFVVPARPAAGPREGSAGELEAHVVFESLIDKFRLEPPRLIQDPLGFLADQIDKSLPSDPESDVYGLRSVVQMYRQAQGPVSSLELVPQMKAMQEAVQRSRTVRASLAGPRPGLTGKTGEHEEVIPLLITSSRKPEK